MSKVTGLKWSTWCWEMCSISLPGGRWSRWLVSGTYISSWEPALPEQYRKRKDWMNVKQNMVVSLTWSFTEETIVCVFKPPHSHFRDGLFQRYSENGRAQQFSGSYFVLCFEPAQIYIHFTIKSIAKEQGVWKALTVRNYHTGHTASRSLALEQINLWFLPGWTAGGWGLLRQGETPALASLFLQSILRWSLNDWAEGRGLRFKWGGWLFVISKAGFDYKEAKDYGLSS